MFLGNTEILQPTFVHPMEATFARILDYYGIRWEYEPRTFPIEWDEDGRVTVAFTPDFYLPDQDLYVELTTLRPKLMRQKHAKLRRMHELYPEIKIKLFRRQDLRDLMIKFGMDEEAERLLGTQAARPDEQQAAQA
jgi:hypoxanthine phosphoribosyltransferase